ncbi:MAG: phosphatase PAP2 family protein [Lachnospiraceae bacterium]
MTTNQYKKWTKPFVEHPRATKVLLFMNKILTILCYILFPLLLIMEWMTQSDLLLRSFLTAGISFVAVTLFRKAFNKTRPYEALDIVPLIKKDKKGQSFPSRHVFSVFVIAMCWLYYIPIVGILLLLVGIIMAWIRVIGGVHYPIDVIAGAMIGMMSGIIGFVLL